MNPESRVNGDWMLILERIESARTEKPHQSLLDDYSLMYSRLAFNRLRKIRKIKQSRGDVSLQVPLAVWVHMVFECAGAELKFHRRLRRGLARDARVNDYT